MAEILSYWDPSSAAPAFGEPSSFYDSFNPLVDDEDHVNQQPRALFAEGDEAAVKMEDVDFDAVTTFDLMDEPAIPLESQAKLEVLPEEPLDPLITTALPAVPAELPSPQAAAPTVSEDKQKDLPPSKSANAAAEPASTPPSPTTASAPKIRKRTRKSKPSAKLLAAQAAAAAQAASKTSSAKEQKEKSTKEKEKVPKEEDKRDKFLERNRIAASKCRQKRKEWMHNLEEQKQEMENVHWQLQQECHMLIAEVSKLKNMIMEHAHCHDERVDRWIESEARRIVGSSVAGPAPEADLALGIETGSSAGSVIGSGRTSVFDGDRKGELIACLDSGLYLGSY